MRRDVDLSTEAREYVEAQCRTMGVVLSDRQKRLTTEKIYRVLKELRDATKGRP